MALKQTEPGMETTQAEGALPVRPEDLDKLARWVPMKEMALLAEICERARCERDLARPALLLFLAYAERVARLLDQDPFPTITKRMKERLHTLRGKDGL
jgi:hypothetical protein